MATMTHRAATSALESPQSNIPVARKNTTELKANGSTQRSRDTKYRHVFATHSSTRNSALSYDADKPPSFVGFRNLMILVLSTPLQLLVLRRMANLSSRLQPAIDDCKLQKGALKRYNRMLVAHKNSTAS